MGLEATDGQANADLTETTAAAPDTSGEQSTASNQTTNSGPGVEDVESFFDPKSIEGKPELQAAYKQMQGEFTKRNQHFAGEQKKLDAYNAFISDPLASMRQVATQYGWNLIEGQDQSNGEFQPKTWDDVQKHFLEQARKDLAKEFAPLTNEVQSLKKQNVESQLDRDYPDWRTYETKMSETLQLHPTLVNDVDSLYRMSVPPELLEQRSMKAALAKVKGGTDSSQTGDNKTTSIPTSDQPKRFATVREAADWAKAHLASQGITGTVD